MNTNTIIIIFLLIINLSVISLFTHDLIDSKYINWYSATDNTILQRSKIALFPWIIMTIFLYFGNTCNNIFIPSVVGFLIYTLLFHLGHYLWVIYFDKEPNILYEYGTYVLSVFIGVYTWIYFSTIKIKKRNIIYDRLFTIMGFIGIITYYLISDYSNKLFE